MTREEALKELAEIKQNKDTEEAHVDADDVLCQMLSDLGYLGSKITLSSSDSY